MSEGECKAAAGSFAVPNLALQLEIVGFSCCVTQLGPAPDVLSHCHQLSARLGSQMQILTVAKPYAQLATMKRAVPAQNTCPIQHNIELYTLHL
jgi:hypothetical protein